MKNNNCDNCNRKEIRRIIKESIFRNRHYILTETKENVSRNLLYHIDNNIRLSKNIFRPSSESFNCLFREARALMREKRLFLHPDDEDLLNTDIGETGLYEGLEVPLDLPMLEDDDIFKTFISEGKKKNKKNKSTPQLNKPKRNTGTGGKYVVYVRDPKKKGKNKIKRVTFGAKGMSVGINDPKRVKSFVSRHRCKETNDRTSARWWSCRLPRYAKSLGLTQTGKKWW
jgi:hypothetical protein